VIYAKNVLNKADKKSDLLTLVSSKILENWSRTMWCTHYSQWLMPRTWHW